MVDENQESRPAQVTLEQARIFEAQSDAGRYDGDDYDETTTQIVAMIAAEAIPSEEVGKNCLVVLTGPEIGRRYVLDGGTWSVGRDTSCTFRFGEPSLSRQHAELVVREGVVTVRDHNSTNGTYVDDEEVESWTLSDGEILRFGRVHLKYLSGNSVEHAYHEELRKLTTMCSMTQTFNRRHFRELMKREISRSRRHERPLSVLMIDLDRFKSINDIFGHLAGDHALKAAASVFRACLREEDALARYGGEEFAVVLPDTNAATAGEVAERMRLTVAESDVSFKDCEIPVTVSIGVAQLNADDGIRAQSLLARADESLYQAKNGGRNRVVINGSASS